MPISCLESMILLQLHTWVAHCTALIVQAEAAAADAAATDAADQGLRDLSVSQQAPAAASGAAHCCLHRVCSRTSVPDVQAACLTVYAVQSTCWTTCRPGRTSLSRPGCLQFLPNPASWPCGPSCLTLPRSLSRLPAWNTGQLPSRSQAWWLPSLAGNSEGGDSQVEQHVHPY